ncbi:hypothetical protein AMIS_32530 [Actinoplanes missouriensis 431]|uniref:Uncharacterized protein n=1 Tax=Actinoplanes missouriensis (strain ATCC 14538 / DSM 43046 / CBS 188.64 / JCM 3121 / NBRC 102363 / NCIMB 12654 / NRRL B-3342 / UNCC 431) TaxID=512565 RepID=I0H636_ACTM4|nr:hypothetical protein [Actinoplanes missouriensis]BAL88473.1 hypothetical protein AMIS_32530 [Actinoplanes missouriensis 431]
MIRRFVDLLGRTMWDFPGSRDELGGRYLVLAHAKPLIEVHPCTFGGRR